MKPRSAGHLHVGGLDAQPATGRNDLRALVTRHGSRGCVRELQGVILFAPASVKRNPAQRVLCAANRRPNMHAAIWCCCARHFSCSPKAGAGGTAPPTRRSSGASGDNAASGPLNSTLIQQNITSRLNLLLRLPNSAASSPHSARNVFLSLEPISATRPTYSRHRPEVRLR